MKILIIDDDPFFQKFCASKLTENGYEVEVASDGKEGLEKATNGSFDAILLDLILPELDGFGVLQAFASNEKLKTIPVIVFSSLGQEHDVSKAMQLGAKGFINKGLFNQEELISKLSAFSQGNK